MSLVGDPARYGNLGLPVVADRFPGEGPLAGIEAALRTTTADWNLMVACDMPSLDASTMEALFEALAAGGDCAAPSYSDGRVEPLCAVYHRRLPSGRSWRRLKAERRKVTDALHRLAIRYVSRWQHRDSFANLNTPEDWSVTGMADGTAGNTGEQISPTTSNSGTFTRRSTSRF